MHYINEQKIWTIIELAERCYPQQESCWSGGNPLFDAEVLKRAFRKTPEKEKLEEYIDGLSDKEKAGTMALVWLGRRNRNPEQWKYLLHHAKSEISDAAMYLAEKQPLADYLRNGLKMIRSLNPKPPSLANINYSPKGGE